MTRPLISYYGDDFTGSTDVMEALASNGVETVLFLKVPDAGLLSRFAGARAFGLAGTSRSETPDWMDVHLREAFGWLKTLDAELCHYKVCSTFDSAPHMGSIGKAVDLGVAHAPGHFTPMIVGAPRLRRFQAFGNLFATIDDVGYRLDRHPTMARHPVTPMGEADLALHLSHQTERRIALVHLVQLKQGRGAERLAALAGEDIPIVLIDVLDDETLAEAGRLVWENRGTGLFTASSSGLQYALVAYWRACGALPPEAPPTPASAVERIAVVSGSCSPATQAQIAWASGHGFEAIRLDAAAAVSGEVESEAARCADLALAALGHGRDPLVFSASGPADPSLAAVRTAAERSGLDAAAANRRIGQALAGVMRTVLDRSGLTRVAVAGGDTSGDVASSLGLMALTALAPLAPGSPLCAAWSDDPSRPPLEVALKGGQVGAATFFGAVKAGAPMT